MDREPHLSDGLIQLTALSRISAAYGGGFKAAFGYQNNSDAAIDLHVGADNKVYPNPNTPSGQPTTFQPGRQYSSFSVTSANGQSIAWHLAGAVVTATPDSPQADPVLVETGIVVNVCEEVLQHLFHAPSYDELPDCPSRSWSQCLSQWECCVTKSICLTLPECVIDRVVETAAAYWDQSTNVSCELKSFKEEFVTALVQTTGLPDILLPAASTYLDICKMGADPLSDDVKAIIHNLIQPFLDNGTAKFQLMDLDQALVHKSDDTVAIFTGELNSPPVTHEAQTLENMVIFDDLLGQRVDAATGNMVPGAPTPEAFLNCQGDPLYHWTIDLLVHELVHMRQYREMGADLFVEQYLYEVVSTGGDTSGPLETEAYGFQYQVEAMYNSGPCGQVLNDNFPPLPP